MQRPSQSTPSHGFCSSYQRYKTLSNTFIAWLLSTYDSLSSSTRASNRTIKTPSSTAKPSVADLERFARFIVDCPRHGIEKVPRSILNCLYKIIQRRSEAHIYYSQCVDSDTLSNQSHVHFICALEKMFDTLGGEAWIQEHLMQGRGNARKMGPPINPIGDPSPTRNRFFAFSTQLEDLLSLSDDDDDEETDANHWPPNQPSASDSQPGKGRRRSSATARQSKKRFRSIFPDFSLGEDGSDEMFTRFCFFDDLNMLRKHIRCIWTEWATEPTLKGLVVAAMATDVAVRMAESLEIGIIGYDPSLTGMDPETTRDALLSFDGMVRASDDWTIGLMGPYYEAILDTKVKIDANTALISTGASPLPHLSLQKDEGGPLHSQQGLAILPGNLSEPHHYWGFFMSRMAGELSASPGHTLFQSGESCLNQLLRGNSETFCSSLPAEVADRYSRLQAVKEDANYDEVKEVSVPERDVEVEETQPIILRESVIPKPCLIFAAQVYLDIEQITLAVEFPYQHVVTELGKKIYMYMNWLSCQSLKRHIKTLKLNSFMDLFPVMDDIPAMKDRRPHASMSLAPAGVWQEGMGDFGRLVGVKIFRDIGAEVSRGVVAKMNPNRDSKLSAWSWGSRAVYILAESLRFGAKAYNEGGMFIAIAHIYNALRESCSSVPIWRHMESFLAIHGNDIFNGCRPTRRQADSNSPEFFYNRWRLRMGLPLTEFSKGKRTGQFKKREKIFASRSNFGAHGCRVANPDVYIPALTMRRPKPSANRNTDGISKDILAVKLVEKRMHLDTEALKLLTALTSRNHGVDPGYVMMETKERLDEDMAKMSRNLFAMEAYCQRVIERVINSVSREMLNGFLENCGLFTDGSESTRWEIRENLPAFAALVLLLLESYHPLYSAWVQAFEAIAEEDEDAGFVLIHEDAVLPFAEPGHVEEVVE